MTEIRVCVQKGYYYYYYTRGGEHRHTQVFALRVHWVRVHIARWKGTKPDTQMLMHALTHTHTHTHRGSV